MNPLLTAAQEGIQMVEEQKGAGLKLRRSIDRWRQSVPSAMANNQSLVAIGFAFDDARHDILALYGSHSRLLEALLDALEFIEDQEDVVDGPDGEQRPNRAMSLAQDIRAALSKAGA